MRRRIGLPEADLFLLRTNRGSARRFVFWPADPISGGISHCGAAWVRAPSPGQGGVPKGDRDPVVQEDPGDAPWMTGAFL